MNKALYGVCKSKSDVVGTVTGIVYQFLLERKGDPLFFFFVDSNTFRVPEKLQIILRDPTEPYVESLCRCLYVCETYVLFEIIFPYSVHTNL